MAYTTINKSSLHMNTVLVTGNNSTNAITGVGFAPDMIWTKKRNGTANHLLYDKIRGVGKYLYPNLTNAEGGNGTNSALSAFGTDGFTLNGDGDDINASGATGLAWNWIANGAGSANTDGDINSTVSVNTTAGFSIVKYTGNATANQSIGHGLGVRPKMIMIKNTSTAGAWMVWHDSLTSGSGTQKFLQLDNNNAQNNGSAGDFPDEPTTSVFKVGSYDTMNKSGDDIIAYCFAEKTGYSKFGSYEGNGNADGAFVYTGFKPAFVIVKRIDSTKNWYVWDNKRDAGNDGATNQLYPNLSAGEDTGAYCDFLSNGFKLRNSSNGNDADTHIYMAFASAPLVGTNNVPCTAR